MGKNYHPSYQSNYNILSTSDGAYYVSKVNILIGIVNLIIWILLSCLSLTVYYLIDKNSLYKQLITNSNILQIFALLGIILFTSIEVVAVYKQSNSSFLDFNKYKPLLNKDVLQAQTEDCRKLSKIIKKRGVRKMRRDY